MFRFTIRDVLWLMVIVGMGIGWWQDRSHLATEVERYKEPLMKARRMGLWLGDIIGVKAQADLDAEWENEHAKRNPNTGWTKWW